MYNLAQKYADFNGEKFKDTNTPYSGLPTSHWGYAAAKYCNGCSILKVNANADLPITREEFCDAIWKFIKSHCTYCLKHINLITDLPFVDLNKNSNYLTGVQACYTLNLILGVNEKEFMPEKNLTRAEMSQIIYRLVKVIELYEC